MEENLLLETEIKPQIFEKSYLIYQDNTEKVYDILDYEDDGKKFEEFEII